MICRSLLALLSAAVISFSAGCSSTAPSAPPPAAVSAQTFTYAGDPVTVSAPAAPTRVVAAGNSAIDTLAALGVSDAITAAVTTEGRSPDAYRDLLPQADISDAPFSKEYLLTKTPDCIIGWRRFFSPKQMDDALFWSGKGCAAYIEDASGPIPSLDPFPPCTVESEENFIRNMGRLFRREKEAAALISSIRNELSLSPARPAEAPKVLAIELQGKNIEIFGKDLLSGDIVKKLGGTIIDFGHPFLSEEELLLLDADIIFVIHHGDEAEARAQLARFRQLPFENSAAFRNERIYPLPYESIVAPAVHTGETIRYMRQCMYGQ